MSVDLVVSSNLSGTPQAVQDQAGNSSVLYLSNGTSGTVSLPSNGKIVLGIAGVDGYGEWVQNTGGITNPKAYGISLFANSKEQMRLTNDGRLIIGTSTDKCNTTMNGSLNVDSLNVSGSFGISGAFAAGSLTVSGAVTLKGLKSGSGSDVVCDSNGTLALQTSSARFKENIRELKDDFSRILSLIPVSFTYKDSGQEAIGYTAEELHEKELHHLVSYDEEGKPFSVNYKMLPVYLLEIVKKQQEMISRLEQGLANVLGGPAPAAEPAAG
jgi:hypothetical protein